MHHKPTVGIQPLLPTTQSVPRSINTSKQASKFNIKRFDQIHRDTVIDTIIQSLNNVVQTPKNENRLEVFTIDYKHGLHPAISSSSIINLFPSNQSADLNSSPPPELPSLLSIKTSQPKNEPINLFLPIAKNIVKEFPENTESKSKQMSNKIVPINDILQFPKRTKRPSKLVIFLRGLPGSGKSYLTNLIKLEEEKHTSEKPKIFSIDNYFINEQEEIISKTKKVQTTMKYEYDPSLDDTYQRSLVKSFKKTIDDGLFGFLIVDMINEKMSKINDMNFYASTRGFSTFIVDFFGRISVQEAATRNIHNRTLSDIVKISNDWESLPNHYTIIDASLFCNQDEIENVEMEDMTKTCPINQEPIFTPIREPICLKSKWDSLACDKVSSDNHNCKKFKTDSDYDY